MKFTIKPVTACVLLAANLAYAQPANFSGFSASLVDSISTSTMSTPNGPLSEYGSRLDLRLEYTWRFQNNVTLGAILEHGLSGQRVGTQYSNSWYGNNQASDWSLSDRVAIGCVPGLVFGDNSQLFGILAVASARQNTAYTYGTDSLKTGVSYGAGIKHLFSKNVFAQVVYEIDQYQENTIETVYNVAPGIIQTTRTTIRPITSNGLSIGFGMYF